MKAIDYKKHFVCVGILFVLGNAIISLPRNDADNFTFLGFLVSFLISFLLYFILFLLPCNKAVLVLASLLSIWAIGDTVIDFISFINQTLLKDSPKILIALPFLLTAVLFCSVKQTAILKFSLISAVISVIAIFFFFAFTATDFRFKNIVINSLPDFKNLCTQTTPYLEKVTLPSLVLVFYARLNNFSKTSAYCGMAAGNLLLAFCLLNSVLLFGSGFAARLDFPYAFAISTVTFGNLFCRLDGFAYFIYFASCIIKITISAEIIKATKGALNKE